MVKCPKCKAKISEDDDFCSECGTSLNSKKGMHETTKSDFGKGFNSFICALLLSIGVSILLAYSFTKIAGVGFLTGLIGFTYWFYAKTDTKKRAWGRTFIGLSIESFLLPVVMFIFTVAFVTTQTSNGAEAVGGAIGGGIAIFLSAILGGFLGIVFLIAGIFTLKSANKDKGE